jgi:FMN phosphatase YigB (HAD superfamily)
MNLNKKVYIFDLDNTLILHESHEPYKSEYHERISLALKRLKSNGKILCLVTYNSHPAFVLKDLFHLFDHVYSPEIMTIAEFRSNSTGFPDSTPWMCGNQVRICKNKVVVIGDILRNIGNVSRDQVIFFDDDLNHVCAVQRLGVVSVPVNPARGIPLEMLN